MLLREPLDEDDDNPCGSEIVEGFEALLKPQVPRDSDALEEREDGPIEQSTEDEAKNEEYAKVAF